MLGTGHATVTNCYNTCFTISENNKHFLVDAGGGNGILKQLKDSNINQSFKDYLDYFINKTDFNENYSYFIVVELEKGNDYYYYTLKVK